MKPCSVGGTNKDTVTRNSKRMMQWVEYTPFSVPIYLNGTPLYVNYVWISIFSVRISRMWVNWYNQRNMFCIPFTTFLFTYICEMKICKTYDWSQRNETNFGKIWTLKFSQYTAISFSLLRIRTIFFATINNMQQQMLHLYCSEVHNVFR